MSILSGQTLSIKLMVYKQLWLEFTWKGICAEDITEDAQELTYKYDDRKTKICEHKYFLIFALFLQ